MYSIYTRRCFALVLCMAALMLVVSVQAQETTSATVELNDAGEPLKPNERRVPRASFDANMEKHWGVKLSEIEDEFIKKIGDETLFITAGGEIFIKKVAPWYPGETGKSYSSTEEMLQAEERWNELADYLKRVRERFQPIVSAVLRAQPRLTLLVDHAEVSVGEMVVISIGTAGVNQSEVIQAGMALSYDPRLLRFQRIEPAPGTQLVDQDIRQRSGDRESVRFRIRKRAGDVAKTTALARLTFGALKPGAAAVEPLSAEAKSGLGKSFIETKDGPVRPITAPVIIQVR